MVLVVPGVKTSNVIVKEQNLLRGLDHFPITFEIAHFFQKTNVQENKITRKNL